MCSLRAHHVISYRNSLNLGDISFIVVSNFYCPPFIEKQKSISICLLRNIIYILIFPYKFIKIGSGMFETWTVILIFIILKLRRPETEIGLTGNVNLCWLCEI